MSLKDLWVDEWIMSDTVIRMIKNSIKQLPIIENTTISTKSKNLVFSSPKETFGPLSFDPKSLNYKEIIKQTSKHNLDKTIILPLFSVIGYCSNAQHLHNNIRDPKTEYEFVYYMHILMIKDNQIIYHQARKFKNFTIYPEDYTIKQRYINTMVESAMKPYFKNLK